MIVRCIGNKVIIGKKRQSFLTCRISVLTLNVLDDKPLWIFVLTCQRFNEMSRVYPVCVHNNLQADVMMCLKYKVGEVMQLNLYVL